mgnify:CR=1 FL=1
MKRLLIFLKGYEKESFLAPLFKMLEATFELIVPLVVARIMDIGIKNQDNVYIWHQCVIMVLLGVIGALVLGVGMCMVMIWSMMIPGILVGIVGIILLLCLIPLVKGLK